MTFLPVECQAKSARIGTTPPRGAFSTGTHRFCHFDTGRCEGEAEFAIIWHFDEHQLAGR